MVCIKTTVSILAKLWEEKNNIVNLNVDKWIDR
jgi:hypothetical protein